MPLQGPTRSWSVKLLHHPFSVLLTTPQPVARTGTALPTPPKHCVIWSPGLPLITLGVT